MDYSSINWRKELNEAPEKVREAILSAETEKFFKEIIDKNRLHIDQAGTLSKEIDMVMLGLAQANGFTKRIEEALRIDHEKALAITKDVNEKMFSVIREHLKESTIEEETQDEGGEIGLDREEILREIESDGFTPEQSRQETPPRAQMTTNVVTHGGVGSKDFLSENVEKTEQQQTLVAPNTPKQQVTQTQPTTKKDTSTAESPKEKMFNLPTRHEVFEEKLSKPVSVERETEEFVETSVPQTQNRDNYKGGVDPYREPLK